MISAKFTSKRTLFLSGLLLRLITNATILFISYNWPGDQVKHRMILGVFPIFLVLAELHSNVPNDPSANSDL